MRVAFWVRQKHREREREMGHLYALDFDGVLCDSCGESSISALKVFQLRNLCLI